METAHRDFSMFALNGQLWAIGMSAKNLLDHIFGPYLYHMIQIVSIPDFKEFNFRNS